MTSDQGLISEGGVRTHLISPWFIPVGAHQKTGEQMPKSAL